MGNAGSGGEPAAETPIWSLGLEERVAKYVTGPQVLPCGMEEALDPLVLAQGLREYAADGRPIVALTMHGWKLWNSVRDQAYLEQNAKLVEESVTRYLTFLHTLPEDPSAPLVPAFPQPIFRCFPLSGCGTPTTTTPTTTFPTPEGLVPAVQVIKVEQVPTVDLNAANTSEVVVENGQTILERAAACVAELTDEMKEAIRGAGAVMFIGHSQGGPVSVMLASHLLFGGLEIDEEATNQPPLVDLNRQRVLLLSLSGVHNGSLEKYASVPYLNRPATRELALMADPSYPFFCGTYLPRLTRLLEAGARMVAVHSHNDSAVSVGSATIDGLDHPRLLRFAWLHPRFEAAARQHRRWRSSAGDPQAWLRDYDGRLGSGFMLGLLEYVLRRRNQGHTDDLARFLQRSPYSATLLQTLPSIFSDLRSVWNSKGTDDFRGTLFRAASKTLSSSASVWQDLEAHKHVDDCPSVYQLGISALLSPSLATPSPSLSVRPTFDLSPAHPQEWNRFVSLLLSLPAVDPLRYAFAASLSSADSDLPEPLSQALSAFHFETPPPLHALLEPLHASFPAVPHRQLLKLLVDNRLDSLHVRQLIEHQQRVAQASARLAEAQKALDSVQHAQLE